MVWSGSQAILAFEPTRSRVAPGSGDCSFCRATTSSPPASRLTTYLVNTPT